MRFIKGDSLKEAVERFHKKEEAGRAPGERTLELRQLLERFVDVCNAVAYAHSRGVLHRDLKPGNVMLGPYGETLVVDWGLARLLGRRPEHSDSEEKTLRLVSGGGTTATQMGSALGTPQFMSPEQAAGRLDQLGPASDVYSLGATLYVLLTGRPPIEGHETGEVLRRAQRGEFPPPRQVKKGIPAALEAVCLKAMALRPEDRYGSAGALADDIERWLADEPVLARREPWWMRVRRWARRHRPLVALAAGLLLALTAALAVTTFLIRKEHAQTEDARAQAQANFETAAQERGRAEANYARARQAVDEMLTRVGQERLAYLPQVERVRKELLGEALKFYQEFLTEKGDDPQIQQQTGRAFLQVGKIQALLGENDKAEASYRKSLEIFEALARDFPDVPDHRSNQALVHKDLANLLSVAGRPKEAEKVYRQAQGIYEKLVRDHPAVPDYRSDLALNHKDLGNLLLGVRRTKEAEASYRQALGLFAQLVWDFPTVPAYRQGLAFSHHNLGHLLDATERPAEAEVAYRKALAIRDQLAHDFPAVPESPEYRRSMASSQASLAKVLYATGRPKEAEQAFRKALKVQEKLADDFPAVPLYKSQLAISLNNLGLVLEATGRKPEAEQAYRQAVAIRDKLVHDFPTIPAYRREMATTLNNLAELLRKLGRPREAEEPGRRALALREQLARDFPEDAGYRAALATSHNNLGLVLEAVGRRPEAEQAYRQAVAIHEKLAREFPEVAAHGRDLAVSLGNLASLLRTSGRPKEAEETYQRILALRKKLAPDFRAAPGK
jgi:serine/threonine-protein kinase